TLAGFVQILFAHAFNTNVCPTFDLQPLAVDAREVLVLPPGSNQRAALWLLRKQCLVESDAVGTPLGQEHEVARRDKGPHHADCPEPQHVGQSRHHPIQKHTQLSTVAGSATRAMNHVSSRPGAVGSIRSTHSPAASMAFTVSSRPR